MDSDDSTQSDTLAIIEMVYKEIKRIRYLLRDIDENQNDAHAHPRHYDALLRLVIEKNKKYFSDHILDQLGNNFATMNVWSLMTDLDSVVKIIENNMTGRLVDSQKAHTVSLCIGLLETQVSRIKQDCKDAIARLK